MLSWLVEVEAEIRDATVQVPLHQRLTFIGRHLIRIPEVLLSPSILHGGLEIPLTL